MNLNLPMKTIVALAFALLSFHTASSQNLFKAVVKDSATHEFLIGATAVVKGTVNGASADENGEITISGIPSGEQTIVFSSIGHNTLEKTFLFPLNVLQVEIFLSQSAGELEEVIIEGTRSNKSIADNPTRVEVLTEEIDEASTMDPSKISHLITHSTGIQVQQTSATSNTANVRIQGLDGRYTQILKDGFPLYGGFSGSLSIMQIPPLDLRQVEYIKGSSSTLYGGGAISGLINLISKEPTHEETLLHLNGSHIGAFDVNTYMSRKIGKAGFTLLAQRNTHRYFDADDDGYSDMPQLTKYNLNPKLFFYFNEKTKLSAGGTFTEELRQGGDVNLMNHEYPDTNHFYREVNDINRITTQVKLDHNVSEKHSIALRNSLNFFHRGLQIIPSGALQEYRFAGEQFSSFSEVAYSFHSKKNVLIAGINFYSEDFNEDRLQSTILRDEEFLTAGSFINYTFDAGKMVSLETGFRGDYVFDEGFLALPRVSALFKWTQKLTTRISGGMGYRNPTLFNQEAELFGFQNVLPVDKKKLNTEQSYGGNADIGFKTAIGEHYFLNINQMFFMTHLDKPLTLTDTGNASGVYHFINADGYTLSYGGETFFKFGFYDFVLFAGYTYTYATNHFNGVTSDLTLTPRHSLKGDLLYSLPGKWRIGVDYEFKSSQKLSNGKNTNAYWTFGALVEHTHKQFTFFGNVENYTDVRQTNYESMRSAPYNTPQFTEVWAPLDGIVFNCGVKVRL
jgi:outer membrane receptor for ferrienterochelin and colicins